MIPVISCIMSAVKSFQAKKRRQAARDAEVARRVEQLIELDCPECGNEINVAEMDDIGEIIRCDLCGENLLVTCDGFECLTGVAKPVRIKLTRLSTPN